jgi:23S rRNA (cytosine1962-C5)-methyltransferase
MRSGMGVLSRAVELRRRLRIDEVSDAYRLVHAEGDGLSGLIVEKYADVLVFEVFSLGMYQRCRMIAEIIGSEATRHGEGRQQGNKAARQKVNDDRRSTIEDQSEVGTSPHRHIATSPYRLLVRADDFIERTEGFRVDPSLQPDVGRLIIREHGVRYRVDVASGHKTGFFCDQRDNRRQFAGLCRDASVLDLCCYTGGFSVCAKVLGGAREVIGVDLDEDAVAMAKENANLNQTRIDFVHSDAFIYLRQMIANGRKFDAVVLDPPKLAGSREEFEDALIKYHDLNALACRSSARAACS